MIPDPEDDFEGCLDGLVKQVESDIAGLTPLERNSYFLRSASRHLARLVNLHAPEIMIEWAARNVFRLARKRRRLVRAGMTRATVPS